MNIGKILKVIFLAVVIVMGIQLVYLFGFAALMNMLS